MLNCYYLFYLFIGKYGINHLICNTIVWCSRTGTMRHSPSEPALHQRSHSTSRSSSLTRSRPDLTTPTHVAKGKVTPMVSPFSSNFQSVNQDYVLEKSTGLDLEDFLPVFEISWQIESRERLSDYFFFYCNDFVLVFFSISAQIKLAFNWSKSFYE